MPSPEETRRRLIAGRELRGKSQMDLGALLEADGLGKHDPGRIERFDAPKGVVMQRAHRDAITRHLELPEWWFVAGQVEFEARLRGVDFDRAPGATPQQALVGELRERLRQIEQALAVLGELPTPVVVDAGRASVELENQRLLARIRTQQDRLRKQNPPEEDSHEDIGQ